MFQYFEFLAGPGPVWVAPVFVVAVAALARLVKTSLVLRFCRDLMRKPAVPTASETRP